nr:uncharacterized protein LOC113811352 [Penaeus vannamei]
MSGVWVPPVAVSGTEVKFTCHYETSPSVNDTLYSLKWYRGHDQFYEYIPKNKPPMKVYESAHVHVDKSQSDANTVVLKGITRETSGSFQCEVMGDKPLFETDNYTKNMTVVDIPTWGPRLTHRPLSSKVGVQDIIQARCEVGPSDPPTEITWLINRTPAPPYARVETYKNENRVHVSPGNFQQMNPVGGLMADDKQNNEEMSTIDIVLLHPLHTHIAPSSFTHRVDHRPLCAERFIKGSCNIDICNTDRCDNGRADEATDSWPRFALAAHQTTLLCGYFYCITNGELSEYF